LEQEAPGTSTWAAVASTTSGPDGSYAFTLDPAANAMYRAVAQAGALGGVTCAELDSPPVPGRVFAAVTVRLGTARVRAGDCVQGSAAVKPPKPGQHVMIQRRGPSGWATEQTLTLDSSSRAAAKLCEGWNDLGRV